MNKLFIFILIFTIQLSFSQKKEKFKKGAKITERVVSKNYTPPKSIFFVFKGYPHFVYFYKDLQSNLEKVFKNSDIKLGFSYVLSSNKPLKVDLESLPKTKDKYSDFQVIAAISLSFVKSINSPNVYQRKQNYNLIMEVVDVKLDSTILKTIINVKTYNTILTQNKKTVQLIYQSINSN